MLINTNNFKWNSMATRITPFDSVLNLTNGLQHAEFHVGPKLPSISPSPVKNISEYIARRADDDQLVTLKILSLSPQGDDYQGKLLLHNEHSILSLLQDQVGVIHHHGLFRNGTNVILVLDCLYQHGDDDGQHKDYINLQQYVIKEKRLPEREALQLFYFLVNVVREIHEKKIVHRDLKLGNVVVNRRTGEVILTNFALGKHLVRHDDLLSDQRGSLAYVSPDVLSGEPYHGKLSDMWSLGVLLYTMICGQFPFYDNVPQELFKKIRTGKFSLPRDISMETAFLLKQLIELDPRKRLSAASATDTTQSILSRLSFKSIHEPVQIVPEVDSSQSNECLVPDQDSSANQQSSHVNVTELTAPRLHLYPFIESNENILQASPTLLQHSPVSPTSVPLFVFPDSSSWTHSLNTSPVSLTSYSSSHSLPVSFHPVHPSSLLEQPDLQNTLHLQTSSTRNAHRHSFSEGDPSSNVWLRRLLVTTPTSVLHGRRSVGSMGTGPEFVTRNRRNSHSYSLSILGGDGSRTRRRSYEARDSEREILIGLQATNITGQPYITENINND